ncbi:MAG: THUMP domain-containing protein [Nitrososphaerota archaeon]|nr:THUMP domain-containing protein [Candidatus Calditenuaceae archaeon]MDW8073576.1 THUMP domain-containing protein [Nitrososphaerota archaeon]
MRFFATTVTGLEDIAAAEVSRLLGVGAVADVSKVFFEASLEGCALLNYSSKSLNKIYLLVTRCEVEGLADVDSVVGSAGLVELIDREQSFAVRAERHGTHAFTSMDLAASVGRAIIESYRSVTGVRLKVNLNDPDVEFLAILRDRDFILGVNTTGVSLHRRYYRVRHHRAGLSPTVAHSMLMVSGWRPGEPLLDPFCGSGTIPIEAAMHALNIHPGLRMETLALRRLRIFSPEMLDELAERLRGEEERPRPLEITGLDASPKSLADAEENLERAGLKGCVRLVLGDALSLEKHFNMPSSRIVCNPPFGVRMGLRDPQRFYTIAFASMKRASPGATLTVIVSKPVVVFRALEEAGWTVTGERKVMLGSIAGYIISATS